LSDFNQIGEIYVLDFIQKLILILDQAISEIYFKNGLLQGTAKAWGRA